MLLSDMIMQLLHIIWNHGHGHGHSHGHGHGILINAAKKIKRPNPTPYLEAHSLNGVEEAKHDCSAGTIPTDRYKVMNLSLQLAHIWVLTYADFRIPEKYSVSRHDL